MQTRIQRYYTSVSHAKRLCSKTCDICGYNIRSAESNGKMVLIGEYLSLDEYGLVQDVKSHAIRDEKV